MCNHILLRRVRLVERIHFDEVLQSSQFSKSLDLIPVVFFAVFRFISSVF